jgi:hypothetical protein
MAVTSSDGVGAQFPAKSHDADRDRTTMTTSRPLSVRRATPADYTAVLAIDEDLNDQVDYMKAMFYKFLQDGQHAIFVVERDRKLIGLINYRFHGSHLVTSMSGRIALPLRGQGHTRQARDGLQAAFLRDFPSVTHELFVTRMLAHLKPGTYTSLYQWNAIMTTFSTSTLRHKFTQYFPAKPLPVDLSYQQTVDILRQTDLFEQFIGTYCTDYVPGQCNWRPMKLDNKTELKELFSTSAKVFVTLKTSGNGLGCLEKSTSSFLRGVSSITSLSYSSIYQARIGVACDVFFFGDDVSAIPGHAYSHARHLTSIWSGNAGLTLNIPATLDVERVRSELWTLFDDDSSPPSSPYSKAPFVLGIRPFALTSKL